MGFAEFNPNVKKVNLKPKGEVEIVLTTYLSDLRGSVETLSDMIDQKVHVALESTVVTYNVEINARTEKPIRTYRVDENGVVSEVKPEGEQLELSLGLPKKEDPVAEVTEEIEQRIVDDFILELLAPNYPDLPYPFLAWVSSLREGETYMRIATDYEMSSGKVSELLDEYRSRVAPLAAKWDEWRQGNGGSEPENADVPAESEKGDSAEELGGDSETGPQEAGSERMPELDVAGEGEMDFTDDGGQHDPEAGGPDGGDPTGEVEISKEALEEFILRNRPTCPELDSDLEVKLDFPTLLEKRRSGETWMGISREIGVPSGQLTSKFRKYKDYVKKLMRDGGAA